MQLPPGPAHLLHLPTKTYISQKKSSLLVAVPPTHASPPLPSDPFWRDVHVGRFFRGQWMWKSLGSRPSKCGKWCKTSGCESVARYAGCSISGVVMPQTRRKATNKCVLLELLAYADSETRCCRHNIALYSYYTILYYTIFYCTILYYTILHYNIFYYIILCYTMLCCAMLFYAMLCYAMLCYTILYHTTALIVNKIFHILSSFNMNEIGSH